MTWHVHRRTIGRIDEIAHVQSLWLYWLLVAGIVCGGVAHLAMGAPGIGLRLRASPAPYHALLLAGAAYVGWMGRALWRQGVALGLITAATQATVYGAVALAAGRLRAALHGRPTAQRWLARAVGLLLAGTAAWALASGWRGG